MDDGGTCGNPGKLAKGLGGLTMVLGGALMVVPGALVAWLLWQALFAVAQEVVPVTGGGGLSGSLIVLFGPISVAWGFHILAVNWLKAGQQVPTTSIP